MKKTLKELSKSGRREIITYKGKGRRYSLSPGNIHRSSLPGAERGGIGGEGLWERRLESWVVATVSFWEFVFSSVCTQGQEVLLLSF